MTARYATLAASYLCLAVLFVAGLSACSSTPREPQIVTKQVQVPVRVACIKKEPDRPNYATDNVALNANIFALVQALLIEREQRKIETNELRAAIEACK